MPRTRQPVKRKTSTTRRNPRPAKVNARSGLSYPFEVLLGRRGDRSRVVLVKSEAAWNKLLKKIDDDGDFLEGYRPAG